MHGGWLSHSTAGPQSVQQLSAQQEYTHETATATTVPAATAAAAALVGRVSTAAAEPTGPPPPGWRALKPGPRLHLHRVGVWGRGGGLGGMGEVRLAQRGVRCC